MKKKTKSRIIGGLAIASFVLHLVEFGQKAWSKKRAKQHLPNESHGRLTQSVNEAAPVS